MLRLRRGSGNSPAAQYSGERTMKFGRMKVALFGLLAGSILSSAAYAQALSMPVEDKAAKEVAQIQPPPPPPNDWRRRPPQRVQPFRVTNSKVDVRIEENLSTTTLEQTFLNQTGRDLEVRVMIPLPAGAAINNSALSMN